MTIAGQSKKTHLLRHWVKRTVPPALASWVRGHAERSLVRGHTVAQRVDLGPLPCHMVISPGQRSRHSEVNGTAKVRGHIVGWRSRRGQRSRRGSEVTLVEAARNNTGRKRSQLVRQRAPSSPAEPRRFFPQEVFDASERGAVRPGRSGRAGDRRHGGRQRDFQLRRPGARRPGNRCPVERGPETVTMAEGEPLSGCQSRRKPDVLLADAYRLGSTVQPVDTAYETEDWSTEDELIYKVLDKVQS